MRKDYEYVDKATSICLTTTDKGSKKIEELLKADKEINTTVDTLGFVQDEYFFIESSKTMDEWYESYVKQYKEEMKGITDITKEEFIKLFTDGYMSIHKVIWD